MARTAPAAVPFDEPVVLVATGSHGIRITAANSRARHAGIHAGMALSDARAGLPAIVAREAEPARDRAFLMRLARWAGRYGPARNRLGPDGLWVDITGAAHLFGGEDGLLRDLLRRLGASGLTARVGLADTLGAAWALARHGPCRGSEGHPRGEACAGLEMGRMAPAGGVRAALWGLPVEALRLDADAVALLRRLGLARIGQLYGLPRASLERRFRSVRKAAPGDGPDKAQAAAAVLLRLDQALGIVAEPHRPLGEPPVLSVRRAYSEPLTSGTWLASEIEGLAGELAHALARADLGARGIRLVLHRADGTVAEARAGFSSACRDPRHMTGLLAEQLERLDAGLGLDVLALDALLVEPLTASQFSLGARAAKHERRSPAALVDRLANRLGADRILVLAPRASHVPERAQIRRTMLAGASVEPPSWPAALTRPLARPPLLLGRPEPIAVTAEIPEGPPARFTWRRVLRRVRKAEGPERVAPEWWRELHLMAPLEGAAAAGNAGEAAAEAQRPARPRDYYRLEDWEGARYWVFRDGLYAELAETGEPRWYLHGVFA